MATSYLGAAQPPEGATVDLDNPQDILRTVNYVTQGLTIFFVSVFVGLRVYAKVKILGGNFSWEDCELLSHRIRFKYATDSILCPRHPIHRICKRNN